LPDTVAVEEPLEIRVVFGPEGHRQERTLSITMRTPGQDEELVRGFLFAERLITDPAQIQRMEAPALRRPLAEGHTLVVHLRPELVLDWSRLERHFYLSSSCGVCGKASIDMVMERVPGHFFPMTPRLEAAKIRDLPLRLREAQTLFDRTGGIHASGLFDAEGELLLLREDVGRHNAADKLVGALLARPELRERSAVAVLSGRASFELVQKFLVAGVPILIAVGAPSSLAVDLAQECGMTLIGFAGRDHFNVYTGLQRVAGD
jgi:FdhD protein